MSEKSEGKGEIVFLNIERVKRKLNSTMEDLDKILDEERKSIERGEELVKRHKPEIVEDCRKMRKRIMKFLSDGKLNPEKARELLDEINELERGSKSREEE